MISDKLFPHRFRYLILIVGCLALTSISSNMLAFNIAQVCMASDAHHNETHYIPNPHPTIDYTPSELSVINAAVGVGTAFATIPFTEAYGRYGAKYPFLTAGLISALATGLMPVAAMTNIYFLLVLRFMQGVAYAADFAAVGMVCSKWASLKQNGLFLGVLTSYSPLSTGITNSVSGMVCNSSYGWPMVFYGHCVVSLIIFSFWFMYYTDKPHETHRVTDVELEKIQRDKTEAQIHGEKNTPYKAILTDIVIWVVYLNAFTEIFSTNFFAVYAPYYMKNVLNYSVEATGHLSAISRVAQVPFRLLCGVLSDQIKCLSETAKLMLFNTITVAGAGVFYVAIGFVPDDLSFLAVLCIGLLNTVTGAACGGFYKQGVLYARQYSHFVIANCQFLKCIVLFLGPVMVALLVQDETNKAQWRVIFLSVAVLLFFSNCVFYKFATSEPAAFTVELKNEKSDIEKVAQ
ncbi:unnamed protein product [Bursaphelenchus okinawaensis]|uniref:Major facilitator superfamily (MFS) profile domain-containing protein n=1 Tax=Bursaphelenchus okinawaensis TaxID=465554 RepID=A0A811KTB4_9BILA|nr:unnamed protein product [Bursaphelenchus okinawaensis]CAG9110995.1 unnamed protein product [Bursaphelenchus okinawaensis]